MNRKKLPKAFVLLTLLTLWNGLGTATLGCAGLDSAGPGDFQFIELFCGSKMATRCVSGAGYRATCIDIQDHEGAGYACGEGTVFDILSSSGMVLAIQAILQGDSEGFVVWFGILCATWSSVSRGSTFRWYLNPLGLRSRRCVEEGNQMVSRCCLLMALVECLDGVWILEQPRQSIMYRHPRFRWLTTVSRVFRSCWWMRLFKATSPKRHVAYSNSCWIARFNLGRLIGWKPSHNKTKNTASYIDKVTGVRKWHGTKALKKTEHYPLRFGMRLVEIFPRLLEDCRVAKPESERDAKEIFGSMEYQDNWDDADLRSCVLYIRGSWKIRIPNDWRPLLPARI